MWSQWLHRDLPNAVHTRLKFGHEFTVEKDGVVFEVREGRERGGRGEGGREREGGNKKRDLPNAVHTRLKFGHEFTVEKDGVVFEVREGKRERGGRGERGK